MRQGLTNPQIAERLGISMNGAKYHVSEILTKLGFASRDAAARWQPERERPWWAAAFAPVSLVWRRTAAALHLNANSLALAASAGVLAVILAGAALIAVLLMRGDGGDESGAGVQPTQSARETQSDATATRENEFGVAFTAEFTTLASDLEQAMTDGDFSRFAENVAYQGVTCTDAQGPPAPPATCAGLPVGATTQAIPVTVLQSEGGYYDPTQFAELVRGLFFNKNYGQTTDAYGGEAPQIYAVAEVAPQYGGREDETQLIVTAMVPSDTPGAPPGRQALMFGVHDDGGRLAITSVTRGAAVWFLDPTSEEALQGNAADYFTSWERWPTALE
jgi:hypothetical protein